MGPWGGGSKILSSIIDECNSRGHQVCFSFEEKVDLIFCFDPRPSNDCDFQKLISLRERDAAPVVQRVGDLGTHGKPELFDLVEVTTRISDFVIFPSRWASSLLPNVKDKSRVIENAPNKSFFNRNERRKSFHENLKIVTHHWSDNPTKGFDLYEKFDSYCCSRKDIEFFFVGRKPTKINIKNYYQPMDVQGLVEFLPDNHVYLTASKFEAGANHVLEAMACGLPVLYHRDGGSINEYCSENGIEYSSFDELIYLVEKGREKLKSLSDKMNYNRNSKDMAREYVQFFEEISK